MYYQDDPLKKSGFDQKKQPFFKGEKDFLPNVSGMLFTFDQLTAIFNRA